VLLLEPFGAVRAICCSISRRRSKSSSKYSQFGASVRSTISAVAGPQSACTTAPPLRPRWIFT